MRLHELYGVSRRKRKHRIGRGGKRGSYSGRGIKGQKSRAGRRIRPAQRDLVIRIPKRRGFKNKPKSPRAFLINLADLEVVAKKSHGRVDLETLRASGFVPKRYRGSVKVLGKGEVKTALTLKGLLVSKHAKMSIEKAGGSINADVRR